MKIRNGFVSNSSSSSFILPLAELSEEQLSELLTKCSVPVGTFEDEWSVSVNHSKGVVFGFTGIRNNVPGAQEGDLQDWMSENGFPVEHAQWEND